MQICLYTGTCGGPWPGCRPPPPHRLGYSQDMTPCRPLPQQHSRPATRPLHLCQVCWGAGRGRGRPQAPCPWGSRAIPSPPGDRHWAQGRVREWGQGKGTAAASDPEQKTGVSTAGSTGGQIWAPGASGLALVARTCCGREAGWKAPVRLFSDKAGKACVWQHCFLGAGPWGPRGPAPGRQGPFTAGPAATRPEEPLKKATARGGRVGAPSAQPGGGLFAPQRPPQPLFPGVRGLLSPGVAGAG